MRARARTPKKRASAPHTHAAQSEPGTAAQARARCGSLSRGPARRRPRPPPTWRPARARVRASGHDRTPRRRRATHRRSFMRRFPNSTSAVASVSNCPRTSFSAASAAAPRPTARAHPASIHLARRDALDRPRAAITPVSAASAAPKSPERISSVARRSLGSSVSGPEPPPRLESTKL